MKRRTFFHIAALGGAAGAASLPFACTTDPTAPSPSSYSELPGFELEEVTVDDLQRGMETGKYRARRIVELYLERIRQVDSKEGIGLNSVIELNPDALAIADALDRARQEGRLRGPLHGIPVMLKDNIDTADQMMTTAGALALEGNYAARDAWVTEKLREAGAVILGKTNLSEWANFRSTRSSSGWSGRGGQTRNPYLLNRTPCGSSAGSGSAASANLCAMTIGTETNGSIVCPSSASGLVGVKPTVGLVSRSGIIPISHTQDTAGPMARTVRDAAILLGALTGTDPRDPVTRESEGKAYKDYTQFLDPDGLQGKRIGIGREFLGFHAEVDEHLEKAFALMREKGATLVDLEEIVPRGLGNAGFELMLYEFKAGVNQYLAGVKSDLPVKNLTDVIAFNKANAARSMPYFQQEILEMADEKGSLEDAAYQEALEKVLEFNRERGIDRIMNEYQLDAIVGPTGGPAWPIDLINGDHFGGGSSSPAARAGYPNITVPAGNIHGLPIGLSFFGRAYTEPLLLAIAYAYEQATQHRQAPKFLPSLEF